ncbi:envelope glycoprotein B [Rhynchospora pubera]|uniref:Envelope glycoprotein B n=1 Tax=Rhynchospora pubera TaxID=906938 RepID=A0AAV8C9Q8_9POAL|nr:envelope glycoprotein B [Rhynchospora pubera]
MAFMMGWRRRDEILVVLCFLIAVSCASCIEVVPYTTGSNRNLIESNSDSSSTVLSVRTERIDPFDHFKEYKGGYNITNSHYWTSTIFTGKYGYILAALWPIGGITLAISSIFFAKKKRTDTRTESHFKKAQFWFIFMGILFLLLTIIASAVAITGSLRFHSSAQSIKRIISRTALEASGTLYNVTKAVESMQNLTSIYDGLANSSNLNSTAQSLSEEATNIQMKAEDSMRLVNRGINILELVTIVFVLMNLLAVLIFLVARPLKLKMVLSMIIFVCWIFTSLFWIYFGLYFFLAEFSGDTCLALDEYQLNPQNSSLGTILPCSDSANTMLEDVGTGIHNLIDQVNAEISAVRSTDMPGLEYVCNPFSGPPEYLYQPDNCSSSTIKIGDIPQALRRYACLEIDEMDCTQAKYVISASEYGKIQVYTTSIQNILDVFPGMERLVNCQVVKDAFSEILLNECEPLNKNAHMTWAGMAVLSTFLMLFIIAWILESLHERRFHALDGLVKLQLSSSNISEDKVEP